MQAAPVRRVLIGHSMGAACAAAAATENPQVSPTNQAYLAISLLHPVTPGKLVKICCTNYGRAVVSVFSCKEYRSA